MDSLRMAVGWVTLAVVGLLGVYVLWGVWSGKINLQNVISDKKNNAASMGRFQVLIFTFVVALSFLYFVTSADATGFPEIPGSVLTLLGISGSAFLVSKGIDGQ
jgi:hypothetical protein